MSQGISNPRYIRVRATEHALRDAFNLLERRHGLVEIVERGVGVHEERLRVCAQCAFHLRTIDGLQRELRRCRAELTKLHYLVAPDALPPPLERADDRFRRPSSPVMMSRPCRKFRRLDAPVLSPIARVDENNGYGDDAALEMALQASLEDAARAAPRRQPAPPPPGPQLHPFG